MKPSKAVLAILAALAVSSIPLHAAPIELDLATNNPNPIALTDSETTYTFTFSNFEIDFLIVAGGGAGGTTSSGTNTDAGGGGGAGGLLEGTTSIAGPQAVEVGTGGSVNTSNGGRGGNGQDSEAFGEITKGGGGGGWAGQAPASGGSGGGAGSRGSADGGTGGSGTVDQGNAGGSRASTGARGGASGGGAGGAGNDNNATTTGADGGLGLSSSITGVATTYAAGGGGGGGPSGGATGGSSATGGSGGDHDGERAGSAADDNTGGGGGGGAGQGRNNGGRGGSGIVVVRYEGPQVLSGGIVSTDGTATVHQFLNTGVSTLGFNAIIAGDISGEGDLVWDGGGTLTLSGTNTFTGDASVDDGTLLINGDSSGATGDLTVNNNTTLGGGGSFGGDVTVAASGNLAPGASVGTLTIGGSLDVAAMAGGAGQLRFELGPVSSSDRIAVDGALDIGSESLGFSDFVFTNTGGLEEGIYTLITSSNLTGSLDPDDLTGTIGDFDAELQISNDDVILVLGDTPPPPAGGYATWAETNAPTGGPDDDFDGDGVPNAIEYVLGGTSTTNDLDKLPVATTDSGNLVFTFRRHPQSLDGTTSVQIEVGTDLESWPTLYTIGADTATSSAGVTVEEDFEDSGLDKITLSIAQDPDDKKFARLKVTVGE